MGEGVVTCGSHVLALALLPGIRIHAAGCVNTDPWASVGCSDWRPGSGCCGVHSAGNRVARAGQCAVAVVKGRLSRGKSQAH